MLALPPTGGWLGLHLEGLTPDFVGVSTILEGWRVNFDSGTEKAGSVTGNLRAAVKLGKVDPAAVAVTGVVYLEEEFAFEPDEEREVFPNGATYRVFGLRVDAWHALNKTRAAD